MSTSKETPQSDLDHLEPHEDAELEPIEEGSVIIDDTRRLMPKMNNHPFFPQLEWDFSDHEPELFWEVPVRFRLFGLDARFAYLGFNHQSNGQTEALSRSWNRLVGQVQVRHDDVGLDAVVQHTPCLGSQDCVGLRRECAEPHLHLRHISEIGRQSLPKRVQAREWMRQAATAVAWHIDASADGVDVQPVSVLMIDHRSRAFVQHHLQHPGHERPELVQRGPTHVRVVKPLV